MWWRPVLLAAGNGDAERYEVDTAPDLAHTCGAPRGVERPSCAAPGKAEDAGIELD